MHRSSDFQEIESKSEAKNENQFPDFVLLSSSC